MADYTNPLIITSPSAERGDDVYAKSATPWQPDPWQQQMQHGEPLAGQAAWELPAGVGGLQTDETYLVFVNSAFRGCTVDDITDTITSVAHGLTVGTRVYFRSSVNPDGIVTGTPYWVDSVTDDTFKLKANEDLSGSFVDLGSEGTAVYFVATSYRSSDDEQIGTIPATDVYIGEGEAAALVEAIIASPILGTADGGLVANVAASKAKTDLIGTVRSLIRW